MNDDTDNQSIFGVTHRTHHRRLRLLAVYGNAAAQPFQRLRRRKAVEQRLILLVNFKAWVHDTMRDLTVVREQQQPFGQPVQPTNRHHAPLDAHEIHHRVATTLVVHRRDVAPWLVQQYVSSALIRDQVAVNLDLLRVGVNLRPEFGNNDAIDADATFDDHLFRTTAGRDAARRQDSLQAFHGHSVRSF